MSVADYLSHRPLRPLANRGDRFTLKWKGSISTGYKATTFGVVPALSSLGMAMILVAAALYLWPTNDPNERAFIAMLVISAAVLLTIAFARLMTFSTIRTDGRTIMRRRFVAGMPVGRSCCDMAEVTIDVGPLDITCTLLNFKPDPPFRFACVLRGLGEPIVVAMLIDEAVIDAYEEGLPPRMATLVRRVEDQGMKGPTAVII